MKVTIQDSRTSVTVEPRDFRVTVSGARGPQGDAGIGIAAGGAEGQILAKASATDYDTEWIDNYAVNVEVYVKNSSGSPMTKGQVVYISGADGTNPTVALAIATTEMGSSKTIGWLKQDLAQGSFGYVITEGLLEGINTNAATAVGDTVWLSPTTAGGVVYGLASKPSAPNHLVFLGYVLRKQINNGKVYVKVQNGFELGELHDVYNGAKTTPVAADALLLRDSADNNLWKRLTWINALAGIKSHMDTFKSVANGYASLDGSGKVPSSELPSYVDDVVEAASFAALPGTGEAGKIYVTLDTNKCYRWSGSVYVEISPSIAPAWGAITGMLSNQTDLQTALDGKVDENSAITGATKTKITFDAKGLVTAGADAAIADITGLQTALDGKQSTLSLTTTGTSGAATLVGSTLNIPQYQGVLTNPVTGTGTAGQVAYFNGTSAVTGSNNLFWDNVNNRLGLALNTGLTARLHVRGSGTTSATTALLVQNSTPSELFKIQDDGTVTVTNNNIVANGILAVAGTVSIRSNLAAVAGNYTVLDNNSVSITTTSSTTNSVRIINTYAPTSGTGIFNRLAIEGTINQTGGANGITRGLYVNPTLTAAADWRSIEFSNNTGWGLYGAGTANNYLGGSLGIGTTSLTGSSLFIQKQITGAINPLAVTARGSIQSDATGNVRYFNVATFSAAATFTTNKIIAYEAEQGSLGLGHTVLEQIGFQVASNLTGATNNYGFYGNIASGTGRWNLYMNGTAANYIAGNTSIGTTTSSGRLTVQGSGTTSATKAFVVNNATPTALLEILDNGRINQTIPGATSNTVFGTNAGASALLSGSFNTFYGVNAGAVNTSGGANTLIGYQAGNVLTTGSSNIYIGRNAGNSNQIAQTNTVLGTFAFLNHTTGDDNIGQGFNAARYYADGTTSATSFSLCTYLGAATRVSGAGVTNEIAIGNNAIGNGSNTATLGNTSITATYLRGNINYTDGGNFVIGTTTGTKIGTATSQKIGLWNATPIVQPTTAVAAATRVGGAGNTVTDTDTFDGYTIAQLVKALRNMGALA